MPAIGFKGINNRTDPHRLGPDWFSSAINGDVDDAGVWRAPREGWTTALAGIVDAYSTRDERHLFGVSASLDLVRIRLDTMDTVTLAALGAGPYRWTEAGNVVFVQGAAAAFAIYPGDEIHTWGLPLPSRPTLTDLGGNLPAGVYKVACTYFDGLIESGAPSSARILLGDNGGLRISDIPQQDGFYTRVYLSDPDGAELYRLAELASDAAPILHVVSVQPLGVPLKTQFYQPPPPVAVEIEYHRGRLWVARYDPITGFSTLWPSIELGFHWFDYSDPDKQVLPGKVVVMGSTPDGLFVGTDRALHALVTGDDGSLILRTLATYGAVPGLKDWTQEGALICWTVRGWYTYPPGQNLSEDRFSIAPGSLAPGGIIESRGYRRALIRPLDTSGVDNNPYGAAITPTPIS